MNNKSTENRFCSSIIFAAICAVLLLLSAPVLGSCNNLENGNALEDGNTFIRAENLAGGTVISQLTINIYDSKNDAVVEGLSIDLGESYTSAGYLESGNYWMKIICPPVFENGQTFRFNTHGDGDSGSVSFIVDDSGQNLYLTVDMSDWETFLLTKTALADMIEERYKISQLVVDRYSSESDLSSNELETLKRNEMKAKEFSKLLTRLEKIDKDDFQQIIDVFKSFCNIDNTTKLN